MIAKPKREEAPNLPVYLWWLAEDRAPGLLAAERRFWRIINLITYPPAREDWRKWRNRPKIGDQVQDCRNEIHTVAAFGATEDDLVFEDGHAASWMHCCDPVRRP